MATPAALADNQDIYRGLRNSNWVKRSIVTYRAFMLRPATEHYPPEEELSLGLTASSAVDELAEHHGTACLSTGAVHALPHGLRVGLDQNNPGKAELHGLPPYSTEQGAKDAAIAMATDLAGLARYVPVPVVE